MTVLAEARLMSIDEFLAMPDSVGHELVEGVLTERKEMGALADHVAAYFNHRLFAFNETNNTGFVFGSETTYRCFPDPRTGRRGDVSFIRRGRLPGDRIPEYAIDIPADVVIEVISPNDLAYEVEEKASLCLANGFGEVWLAYPNVRTLHIYRKGEPIESLDADQTLVGRGVLAGFTCSVASLFPAAA